MGELQAEQSYRHSPQDLQEKTMSEQIQIQWGHIKKNISENGKITYTLLDVELKSYDQILIRSNGDPYMHTMNAIFMYFGNGDAKVNVRWDDWVFPVIPEDINYRVALVFRHGA